MYLYTPHGQGLQRELSSELLDAIPMSNISFTGKAKIVTIQSVGNKAPKSKRHFKQSPVLSTTRRRRYPIDDATDVLRSILTNLHEQWKHEKANTAIGFASTAGNISYPKLSWISIGRVLWQVVKLEPCLDRHYLSKNGITEVEYPISSQKYQVETCQRWGLKRGFPRDAIKAGIRVFNIAAEPKVNAE